MKEESKTCIEDEIKEPSNRAEKFKTFIKIEEGQANELVVERENLTPKAIKTENMTINSEVDHKIEENGMDSLRKASTVENQNPTQSAEAEVIEVADNKSRV